MRLNERDPWGSTYESVRSWQLENTPEAAEGPPMYWLGLFHLFFHYGWWMYGIETAGIDPLIDDIKTWFSQMYDWFASGWQSLWTWLHDISVYIESLWVSLGASLSSLYHWIGEKIEGIITLIGNWASILWEWLISDIWAVVDYIVAPLREVWDYLGSVVSGALERIYQAISSFISDPLQWVFDLGAELWEVIQYLAAEIWDSLVTTTSDLASWIGGRISALAPTLVEYLRDALVWLWEVIKDAFIFVKEEIYPAVYEATAGAMGYLKDEFTHLMGLAYDELLGIAKSYVPMTPEKAVNLGLLMFGSAVGMGALAHGIALSVEAIPNLKYMGVHYLSAFAARMGGFGAISAATMGVLAGTALRTPMTYYLHSLLRPAIPDARLLIEFRAKREVDLPQFKAYMKYHGYSDQWIEKIDSWLWKDPRLFEILYCADVTVPPREWLVRKFQRAGYEDIDVDVLCRVVERRTTRSPRTYYTTALRRNFRHGFMPEEGLREGIDSLEMAPDAIDWIKRAGDLDNIYEEYSDLVTSYRTAYRNDLISEDECKASLGALGIPPDRVDAVVYLEWVRKTPSAVAKERKEIESQWAEVQKEYSRVYVECFQKGLITEEQLTGYLVAIGVKEKVAQMTARYEALKLLPKPKPEEIPVPMIPTPPEPPTYEE